MVRLMPSVLFMCLNTITIAIILTLIPLFAESRTLGSDVQVLRAIKQSIDPVSITSSSFLHSWNFNTDPCESMGANFLGILCTIPQDNSSSRITVIDLEGDGYEGFLTPAVGNLTELTVLNLSNNKFRGPIPSSVSKLVKLTRLLLADNFFSGSLPPRINRLKKIGSLDLSRNRLSGSIPGELSGFRSLTLLDLSNNEFSGRIPILAGLWQLNTLDLSSNQLYGTLPQLPQNLRTLLLGHNLLSGHISSIRRLENLRTLDLSDNRFSGSIDHEILTLPELSRLNVSVNRFTTMEVIRFSDSATQLQVLDVHANRLHGRLPVTLVTYGSLTTVNVGSNLFSGRIPPEYGERLGRPWRNLFLDHNFLVGGLPPQFTNSVVRIRGSLAHNCLSCPASVQLCHGGQRAAAECVGGGGK
ncbi:hypothetical protein RJ640_017036 [Escallonia rubra]|uniref:Leucine-rich repeat-containing N-terminal plant-type domain-containing protein n=1 Tax=Escallonia rubra TaxID=112253 RepID=A0AA88U735_9ASTE|nr:hypothetical protein RJ640_017036 [Escallonia rubra]